jgi:hypothetical protein
MQFVFMCNVNVLQDIFNYCHIKNIFYKKNVLLYDKIVYIYLQNKAIMWNKPCAVVQYNNSNHYCLLQ